MLTPLEIENREFKKTVGGYNRDDVEDFMSLILVDYDKLYRENIASREKVEALNSALENYKNQEATMQNAILAAQKAADALSQAASEKADLILKETQAKASDIMREANDEIAKLNLQYADIKQQIESYKMRVGSIIKSQLDILEDLNA